MVDPSTPTTRETTPACRSGYHQAMATDPTIKDSPEEDEVWNAVLAERLGSEPEPWDEANSDDE